MGLPIPFPASTISLNYGAVDGEYYTFSSPHQGTDFSSRSRGVTAGAAFRASGPGVVTRTGVGPAGATPTMTRPNNLAGNSIDVDYGDYIARYMHRPYDSPSPKAGDRVVEGTLLGVIGNTGLSGGPHLHLELWDKRTGRRVNPNNLFDFTRVTASAETAASDAKPYNPAEPEKRGGSLMPNISIVLNEAKPIEQIAVGPRGRVLLNGQTATLLNRWLQWQLNGGDVSKAGGMSLAEIDLLITQVLGKIS